MVGVVRRYFGGLLQQGKDVAVEKVGGPARARVILVLAAVLSVDTADKGAVGALAPQLEAAFHIGNFRLGLLVAVSSLVGAAVSLPMGLLSDRISRTGLLTVSIVTWAGAEAVSAFSTSYLMLLLTRLALGAVTATAGPAVASLTGDLFPPEERSRIYGYILTGELLGTGVGVLVAGDIGSATSWRVGFVVLAVPTLALAWVLRRYLPEPARGGQSRLHPGDEEVLSEEEAEDQPVPTEDHPATGPGPGEGGDGPAGAADDDPDEPDVAEQARQQGVAPDPENVLHGDPAKMGFREALRWVIRVRTNLLLIISSCLGYFFFSGLRTFAVLFARGRFALSESVATILVLVVGIAAIAGILAAGYLADRQLAGGRIRARLDVAGAGYLGAVIFLLPALLTTNLAIALPLIVVGGAFLAGPNSPGDAARLDIVPSRMWGRTESIRTFIRTVLEAFAPLLFGLLSSELGSGSSGGFGAGVNTKAAAVSAASAHGLADTFLIMLAPLAAAGVFILYARRTYPTDVVTAAESDAAARSDTATVAGTPAQPGGHSRS